MVHGDVNFLLKVCPKPRAKERQIKEGGTERQDRSRISEDKMINAEGLKLLRLGEKLGLEIRNGNTEGDWKGEAT